MYLEVLNFLRNCNINFSQENAFKKLIFYYKYFNFDKFLFVKKEIREELKKKFDLELLSLINVRTDSFSEKFLFVTKDNNFIESVLMKHYNRNTVCVSSQIFCPLQCKFCATGQVPFRRNLTYWEIVLQVLLIEKIRNIKVNNVVFMGMGEPFLNFDNVSKALFILNEDKRIGARHITVSTSGIVPKIVEFAKLNKQFKLAISLHAPNDRLRSELMPINKQYNLRELFSAIDEYTKITNKRVTYEYVLIDNVNDSIREAKQLVNLLKGRKAFVNLLIYNPHPFSDFERPSHEKVIKFKNYLLRNGVTVAIRRSLGDDIQGACGQLSASERKRLEVKK